MIARHEFSIVSTGPPAFTARCTCRDWYLAWDAEELQRRAFDTIATVERAARTEHETHAAARHVLEMHAARDRGFY